MALKTTKIARLLLVLSMVMVLVAGCEVGEEIRNMIFVPVEIPPSIRPVKRRELESGNYYIKDGTNFFRLMRPTTSFTGGTRAAFAGRNVWMLPHETELIPTLYVDEIIAFMSRTNFQGEFILERFADIGYTIGVRSISGSAREFATVGINDSSVLPESSAAEVLNALQTSSIGFYSINGHTIRGADVSKSGTILGLERGYSYTFGMYIGTIFGERSMVADTRVFQSTEIIVVNNYNLTRNGYIEITMPEDMQSGYYYLHGGGFFRFINDRKSTVGNLSDLDFHIRNSPSVLVSLDVTDVCRPMIYEHFITIDNLYDVAHVFMGGGPGRVFDSAAIIAPDGTRYDFEHENRGMAIQIHTPPIGEYTIIVSGHNIDLIDIVVRPGREMRPPVEEPEIPPVELPPEPEHVPEDLEPETPEIPHEDETLPDTDEIDEGPIMSDILRPEDEHAE